MEQQCAADCTEQKQASCETGSGIENKPWIPGQPCLRVRLSTGMGQRGYGTNTPTSS